LIASAKIAVNRSVLSWALSPLLMWVKCRLNPVQRSTSSSRSVILTRGRSIAVWSISAWAVSGTAASSGVIFKPDSVMIASGSPLAVARRLTVSSCSSSTRTRSCRYSSTSVATASGTSLARLSAAKVSTGTRYSSKFLN
jgi:hypothetical protein